MAQGAIALLLKNIDEALNLSIEHDKVHHETGDKGQRDLPFEYTDYESEILAKELPF